MNVVKKIFILSFLFSIFSFSSVNLFARDLQVGDLGDSLSLRHATLRNAINDACSYNGDDTINFGLIRFDNTDLRVQLVAPLEIPTNCRGKVSINGTIQYGDRTRKVVIDASHIPENQCAVKIAKTPSSQELEKLRFDALREQVRTGVIPEEDVKGVVFSGFNIVAGEKRDGVCVSGDYVEVSKNIIGFRPGAAVPQGNSKISVGIRFDGNNGKISENTISYTSEDAIRVSGSDNNISANSLGFIGPVAHPENTESLAPGLYLNDQAGNGRGISLVTYATRNEILNNKIKHSQAAGVEISNVASYSNKILNTTFYHNGGKAISLSGGANHAVPAPVIKSISPAAQPETANMYLWNVQIEGRPNAKIQIFKAEEEDNDHGSGEGSELLRVRTNTNVAPITDWLTNPNVVDLSHINPEDLANQNVQQQQQALLIQDPNAQTPVAAGLEDAARTTTINTAGGQSVGTTGAPTAPSTQLYTFVVAANKDWFPNRQGKITATQTTGDGTSEFSRNANLNGTSSAVTDTPGVMDGTNILNCLLSGTCQPVLPDPNEPAPVLTLVGVSGASVNLSWTFTPRSGDVVSHFVLQRGVLRANNSCDGFDFHIVSNIPATATSYTDSERDGSEGNCYRLYAAYEASSSRISNIVRTNGVAAPTGLTTTASGATVTGSFTHAGATDTHYDVQRAAVDSAGANCAAENLNSNYQTQSLADSSFTRQGSAVSFAQSNVPAGNYCYRVRARTGAGSSILTSGWNPAARPVTVGQGATGPNPRINTPTVDNSGHVVITWVDNTDDEAGFKVERADGQCSANSNFSTTVCTLPASPGHGSVLSCTDNTAERGKTYCYRVTATGSNVNSTITFTVPRVDANANGNGSDSLDTSIGEGGGGCSLSKGASSLPSAMITWMLLLALPVLRLRKLKQ